jgi:hypothetical protein
LCVRVLRSYALRNPGIGYCQGMNFVAGLMLLVLPEESAFWMLSYFCEEVRWQRKIFILSTCKYGVRRGGMPFLTRESIQSTDYTQIHECLE